MNESHGKELAIFFAALGAIAVAFFIGIRFSPHGAAQTSIQGTNGELLANIGTVLSETPIPVPTSTPAEVPAVSRDQASSSIAAVPVVAPLPKPKALPYEAPPFSDADWFNNWGTVQVAGNVLFIGASSSTAGGAAFLNGSESWANYVAGVHVDWTHGETFSVIAREKDHNNFTYCDFGDGHATIIQRVNGADTVIGSNQSPNGGQGGSYDLGVRVYGDDIACTVDGQEVAAAVMQAGAPRGGVGFISWDPATSTAQVSIDSLAVSPLVLNTITFPQPQPAPAPVAVQPPSVATSTPVIVPTSTADDIPPTSTPTSPNPALAGLGLPYASNGFAGNSWQGEWGAVSVSSGTLSIGSSATNTSAGVFLNGSNAWTDYTFNATLDWAKGQTFSLVGRYTDGKNYAFCNFIDAGPRIVQVQLNQVVHGKTFVLGRGVGNLVYHSDTPLTVSMKVQDNYGTCSIGSTLIASPISVNGYYFAPPLYGGIGFITYDSGKGNSLILVSNVSVEPVFR